ncbi:MAG: PQQ-binding-like beta-propeller repeat protein [Saprospiraceae bacterium]|nr:PQQ-binding-like beta-propeller repeat protein [Saprospiraceae bacterium]
MRITLSQKLVLAITFLFCWTALLAQRNIVIQDLDQKQMSTVWTQDFPYEAADITWNMVTSSGTLLIATANSSKRQVGTQTDGPSIQGFDPKTGKKLFRFEVESAKSYDPASFEEIPNTPLIVLANSERKQDQIVINTINGKVVAESNRADMTRVYNRFVLMRSEKILFVGRKGNKSVVAMFDMNTGEFWRQEKMFRHNMVEERVNSNAIEFDDKSFLISTEGGLYCINSQNGETIWRAGIPAYIEPRASSLAPNKDVSSEELFLPPAKIFKNPGSNTVYYLSHMGLMAYDVKTGDKKWKKFMSADGDYVFLPSFDHLIVVGPKTNGYHYETGENYGKSPVKFQESLRI